MINTFTLFSDITPAPGECIIVRAHNGAHAAAIYSHCVPNYEFGEVHVFRLTGAMRDEIFMNSLVYPQWIGVESVVEMLNEARKTIEMLSACKKKSKKYRR